jgi:hypothetical protein
VHVGQRRERGEHGAGVPARAVQGEDQPCRGTVVDSGRHMQQHLAPGPDVERPDPGCRRRNSEASMGGAREDGA